MADFLEAAFFFLYSNTMCNRLNIRLLLVISCFQWFKDTKMKANHNVCACLCVFVFQR